MRRAERTQERMTEVMTEGNVPVWRSRRSLRLPVADSRMRDWGPDRSQCTSVEVPEEPRLPRARGARQQPRRDAFQQRTQECVTGVLTEVSAPVWRSRRSLGCSAPVCRSRRSLGCQGLVAQGNNPGGMQFRADSRLQVLGPNCSQSVLGRSRRSCTMPKYRSNGSCHGCLKGNN